MSTLIRIFRFVGVFVWRYVLGADQSEREIFRDRSGKVVSIGDFPVSSAAVLNGHGTKTTADQWLSVGIYKVEFDFSTPTRLLLIGDNGEHLLGIYEGEGVHYLSIDQSGWRVFRLEPSDEQATWHINYHKMGSG